MVFRIRQPLITVLISILLPIVKKDNQIIPTTRPVVLFYNIVYK